MGDVLKSCIDIVRQIKGIVQTRTLYIPFNDKSGTVANDRAGFGEEYDANYVGVRDPSNIWTGDSAIIDGDYFEECASPINNAKDFTFACWVKTTSPNFTFLSCKRAGLPVLEITNKKVVINGQEFTYA